jgi:O-antigen ligase
MSSQSSPLPDALVNEQYKAGAASDDDEISVPTDPPGNNGKYIRGIPAFWHDRLIEAGLIVSMALYYVIGNPNLGSNSVFHVNPLYTLPFLLVFAALCWYRLPFAIALLPLALPYYLIRKPVYGPYSFSPAEIAFGVCLGIFALQLVWRRSRWQYWLAWRDLRERVGPFIVPMLVFLTAAAFSIVIAYDKVTAQHSFRQEVLEPLLYVVMALYCLRTRRDLTRLLGALLATGLVVALMGMVQYIFFKNTLVLESDGIRRVHAMYGSANSIGLLFDYILPIAFAMLVVGTSYGAKWLSSWKIRIVGLLFFLPMAYVLYLTQSIGAWLAIPIAGLFIAALSIRSRKIFIGSTLVFLIVAGVVLLLFHTRITNFLLGSHVDVRNISTATKRYYLWRTALNMIRDSPWFGYGMDNWLCHYSYNKICFTPSMRHYLIDRDPITGVSTGLKFEPNLSHPHNIFLHVWVSMGIFGLLGFMAVLVLFYWLFVRILRNLRTHETKKSLRLHWMTLGVGGAMLAALVQGMVDSSFLEQDLAFSFWMLVLAMLLLRVLSGTTWRGRIHTQM